MQELQAVLYWKHATAHIMYIQESILGATLQLLCAVMSARRIP